MSNVYSVVWAADSRTILDPRFADAHREGDLMRLEFPLLPGRDFAPEQPQWAWCGDVLIELDRCGYVGRVVQPTG
jgi:hypothetical protein